MTRPNILILMVDQLNGTLFPDGPADWLATPHLKRLASRSVRFPVTYTASPLCAPGRASFMSGQLPRRTRVYDNAAEFASDIPTYAHHLRRAGYQTCLSGKMHFVGPDQLHGFEERLTTDIYPADFGWTPDYRKPGERIEWWYHNLGAVPAAGVAETTNQMDYDDEVAFHGCRKLYDLARTGDDRPWCLTISFTHPHDPYVARQQYWDLYADCDHLDAPGPAMGYDDLDPHSRRIFDANDWRSYDITPENVRAARRAYFANLSYLDDKFGEILGLLDRLALAENTVVLFTSDHGDMLGEKGLWFKMSFYEGSARVPLMIAAPGLALGRIDAPVSTLDIVPTLADLAGVSLDEVLPWTDGESLLPLTGGAPRTSPVAMEYAPRPPMLHWSPCATAAGSTHAARLIPSNSSIWKPIPGRDAIWPMTPPTAACWRSCAPRPTRAGTWPPMMPRSVRARPAAGWSTRRSATAPTTLGTSSRCKRRRNAICATIWT